jgi:hypothetical protein
LDDLVGIVEEHRAGVAAEEAHPFTQYYRDDVHRDLVDQPRRERLAAQIARGDADETVTRERFGKRDAFLDRPGGVERGVRVLGEPLVRQRPVGDDDQRIACCRLAVPPVRRVEQVAADHRDLDGLPEGLDVGKGRLRDLERPAARPRGQLGVAVEVPIEQRPDRVVGIGDVAVHRHDRLHDNPGHQRSRPFSQST